MQAGSELCRLKLPLTDILPPANTAADLLADSSLSLVFTNPANISPNIKVWDGQGGSLKERSDASISWNL